MLINNISDFLYILFYYMINIFLQLILVSIFFIEYNLYKIRNLNMLKPFMTEMLVNTSKVIIENPENIFVSPVTIRKDKYSYFGYYGTPPRCYEKEPISLNILEMSSKDKYKKANYIVKKMNINIEKEFKNAKNISNYLKQEKSLNKSDKNNSIELSFTF